MGYIEQQQALVFTTMFMHGSKVMTGPVFAECCFIEFAIQFQPSDHKKVVARRVVPRLKDAEKAIGRSRLQNSQAKLYESDQ